MPNHAEQLAQELNLNVKNVQGAIELIDQGNTIPFIARYRKEATGSMDDQVLRDLGDRLEYLRGLDKRKDEVTSSITEQGAMTPELNAALSKAKTLAEVEDIYRPYKPKRKTRASIAKARGLQPLATAIFRQDAAFDPERPPRTTSTTRSPMPPRRWPGHRILLPRRSPMMPPAAPSCAATTARLAVSPAPRPRTRTASTPSTTTTPSR